MKLHLGCGGNYFDGYVNIDYPPDKHTIQTNTKVDKYADITKLKFPSNSIEEIRLHHVFEHFSRPIACALLVSWRSWLKSGGIIRIEVPDFDKTAFQILNPFSTHHQKNVSLRHIFGSNEADWAVHYEGWSSGRLSLILNRLGFNIVKIKKNNWKHTYNFEIIAKKDERKFSTGEIDKIITDYLASFLVDRSDSEEQLLKVWISIYKSQVKKCHPK